MISWCTGGEQPKLFGGEQLLSELENWADILKAEPEVIHRLEAFSEAPSTECDADDPSLEGPQP